MNKMRIYGTRSAGSIDTNATIPNPPQPQEPQVNHEELPGYKIGAAGNNNLERNCTLDKLVIDSGAHSVKMGWVAPDLINPSRIIPNFITRGKGANKMIGEEIENCKNFANLIFRRPIDKGYLLDWNLQNEIWGLEQTYAKFNHKFFPSEIDLLLTEPLFNPESLRQNMLEEIFESIGFRSLFNCSPPLLALWDYQTNHPDPMGTPPAGLVVDCGYSFTHTVPIFDNSKINYAIRRIDVGGKLLTNYLKEIVSHRHWNMMDQTYLMNIVKERCCFVPKDFAKDSQTTKLRGVKNTIVRYYVLPDAVTSTLGYLKGVDPVPPMPPHLEGHPRPEEQILTMNNERLIPELLFRPSDIGINQAGIAEAIVQSVNATAPGLHALFYRNIILCGGSVLFPGFKERLYDELRTLVPIDMEINIYCSKDPICAAWRGGSKFMRQPAFPYYSVTRREYQENGQLWAFRRFGSL